MTVVWFAFPVADDVNMGSAGIPGTSVPTIENDDLPMEL